MANPFLGLRLPSPRYVAKLFFKKALVNLTPDRISWFAQNWSGFEHGVKVAAPTETIIMTTVRVDDMPWLLA